VRRFACWLVLVVTLGVVPAAAQTGDDVLLDANKGEIPAAVIKQVNCGTEPGIVTRKMFAGGHVFLWQCPGNHANWIQAVVFATRADGADARLLTFPQAGKRGIAEELSNIRWFATRNELTSLFVDPETKICRTEGRWRLEGTPPAPRLIFWRETRDCNGKRGWRTLVDRR
jgi:hypothetical protein